MTDTNKEALIPFKPLMNIYNDRDLEEYVQERIADALAASAPPPAAPLTPFGEDIDEVYRAVGELSRAMGCPAVYAAGPKQSLTSQTIRLAAIRLAAAAQPPLPQQPNTGLVDPVPFASDASCRAASELPQSDADSAARGTGVHWGMFE